MSILGPGNTFVEQILGLQHLPFDSLSQVSIVDEEAELDIVVLCAPGEVCARHHQKAMIDSEEFRVITDGAAVEFLRSQDDPWSQVYSYLGRGRRPGHGLLIRRSGVEVDAQGDLGP